MAITVTLPAAGLATADQVDVEVAYALISAMTSAGHAAAGTSSPLIFVTGPLAYGYVEMNVGVDAPDNLDGIEYVEENVGFPNINSGEATHNYVEMNTGFAADHSGEAYGYTELGNVDDSDPIPHIWYVRPAAGREGDGFSIFGHGFGETNGEFNGHAYLGHQDDWDGSEAIDAAHQLSETAWLEVVAGPDAYNANRRIDPFSDDPPDMEHQRIDVTVYVGAETGVVIVQTDITP